MAPSPGREGDGFAGPEKSLATQFEDMREEIDASQNRMREMMEESRRRQEEEEREQEVQKREEKKRWEQWKERQRALTFLRRLEERWEELLWRCDERRQP